MKERPILFQGAMVRALLDGSKSQTRRIVKSQPPEDESVMTGPYHPTRTDRHGEEYPGDEVFGAFTLEGVWALPCPYGQPGDRLWVRESFWGCDLPGHGDQPCVVYDDEWVGKEYQPALPRPWGRKFGRIPSIHMPRDCSRILLEIVSVRVERLNDITLGDICKEGLARSIYDFRPATDGFRVFTELWESINGAGSWSENPFVWCVEFKRVTP